jgi:hypothetical protein
MLLLCVAIARPNIRLLLEEDGALFYRQKVNRRVSDTFEVYSRFLSQFSL